MKAVVQSGYGPPSQVLAVEEIDAPTPGAGEVLVRVRATSVHADVWHVVTGWPYVLRLMGAGVARPRCAVPGTDLSGTVESRGEGVSRFHVGDAVFGETQLGMQWKNGGAFAELAVAPEAALAHKPANVTFEQAACVPTAGYIALANLRGASSLEPTQHVLVNGAGGGVGSIAVQVLKARGARVTAVDSGGKLDLLRRLGADAVIDYRREDITRGDGRYDLILDVASTLKLSDCKRILTANGRYVLIGHDHYGQIGRRIFGSLPSMLALMLRARFDRHLPTPDLTLLPKMPALSELRELLASGRLTPVVDRTYRLEEVAEAMDRMQTGRGIGRVLLIPGG